jgi:hypothetical protein
MRDLVFAVAAENFVVRQLDRGLAVHDVPTETARWFCVASLLVQTMLYKAWHVVANCAVHHVFQSTAVAVSQLTKAQTSYAVA